MRTLAKDILTAAVMGLVVPGIVLSIAARKTEVSPETTPETTEQPTVHETVRLPVLVRQEDGTVSQMDMDSYLVGVVLAEMPVSFEDEALEAQSVVARTYARKAWETGGKHGDCSVCTRSACCQGYIGDEDYLSQGGTEEGLEKVRAAVAATSGWVLTYEGELIEATYFSCSGGSTEDAAAVWGTEFPYLQAVASPGEEKAVHYTDTVRFSAEAFQDALGVTLSGSPGGWFRDVTYTDGGGVDTIVIGGTSYKGTDFRSALGLRSTAFSISTTEDTVIITTRGYGHRVGMSQYGADAMAVTGSTCPEILAHYYPGTTLTKLG